MQWIECTVSCGNDTDAICQQLADLGVGGMSVENEQDFRDFLEENRQYWDYVDQELEEKFAGVSRVKFWLSQDEEGQAVLSAVRGAGFVVETTTIEDADWENNWKAFYKPMEIGERLLVIPDWEEAEAGDRVALRLNPGLIFGTGSHATTRLCLKALERHVRPGMKVLDLGCGSGILSIAALLLGAESAFGCDIDEKAVNVAYENAALNGIDRSCYTVRAGDVLSDARLQKEMGAGYDIVVANIVSDVIIGLSPAVRPLMKEGGLFLCSGIIDDRAAEVRGVLEEKGFTVVEENSDQGWFSFLCR